MFNRYSSWVYLIHTVGQIFTVCPIHVVGYGPNDMLLMITCLGIVEFIPTFLK